MGQFSMLGQPTSLVRVLVTGLLLLASSGCGFLKPAPTPILPAEELGNIDEIKADMYPNILDAWTYKDQLLGLSYFVSTRGVMHVNLKMYDELGYTAADFPKNWDELYAQVYEIRDKGIEQPLLPHWLNEWYGISWAFVFEVLNRGGRLADPETPSGRSGQQ